MFLHRKFSILVLGVSWFVVLMISAFLSVDIGHGLGEVRGGTFKGNPEAFASSQRPVDVQPGIPAAGPSSVSATLALSGTASLPNRLLYVDAQGLTTTLTFPVGAVTQTTTIVLTPTLAQNTSALAFAGHAFDLEAYQSGERQAGLKFRVPVTATIYYSERDVQPVLDEGQLTLRYWNDEMWRDAICASSTLTYTRDVTANLLDVPICHLGRFGLFGPRRPQLYLPLVVKIWPPAVPHVLCTLDYITVDKAPHDNHNLAKAAPLANYTGQALAMGEAGSTSLTQADFYRLDNAQLNYRYTVKAVPDKTINYDLGIIVYDKNYTPIITDSNPFDGNSAIVQLTATDYGPYFFEVFQRSEQCKGSTYSLLLSALMATATPGPSPTPDPTFTPGPTPTIPWIDTCMLEYETMDEAPRNNHSLETAAVLANYTGQALTEGTGYPTQTVPAQLWTDYYRLDNVQLDHTYTIKAVPDKTINYDLGIIVYDKDRAPIFVDSDPFDGNVATVTLHATQAGPYYFQVFQRSEQCKGGTYTLLLSDGMRRVALPISDALARWGRR